MGKLIVIEGLDGSGKATQAKLLTDYLLTTGANTIMISFPDYESDSSALIKMYLNGEFGDSPEDVNAYAASSFYAVDRYASFKKNWKNEYEDGAIIIADRYTTSNMIHQCSKLPREQWKAFNTWLMEYEYMLLGIPEPSTVIYLKSEIEIGQELMDVRYHGDEAKKDIHERDIEYLKRCKSAADYCAEQYNWIEIECLENGKLRTINEIQKEIIDKVREFVVEQS